MKTGMRALAILAGVFAVAPAQADEPTALKTEKDRLSYSIGLNLGNTWKRQDVEVDNDWLLRGLRDAKAGGPTLLTEQEVREILGKVQQELMAKRIQLLEQQRQLAEKNKSLPPATNASTPAPPPLTSDIIKVPSREQMEKGEKIETIKAEDLDKLQKQPPAPPEKK